MPQREKSVSYTHLDVYKRQLENLYAHLDDIKGALRQKLADGRASADLSYQLARIVTDAPVTVKLEDCHTRDFNINDVIPLFRELEFRGMTNAPVSYTHLDVYKRQAPGPSRA